MLVSKWADDNNIKITIEMFDSAENFKSVWNSAGNKSFDIFLLDVEMSGQSGIDLAREIRRSDTRLVIIFITGFADYMPEGFDVSAFHYLMKPLKEDKLFNVLDKAVKVIARNVTALFLPVGGEQIRVSIDDIIYIESFAHFSEVITVNGAVKVKMPISELEQQLSQSPGNCARCHRSYIVGLKHVDKITKSDIILDNGTAIPLSRRLYNEVNKALIRYFKGE